MSTQRYYNYYAYAGLMAKGAEYVMCMSAVIFLLNAFCQAVRNWCYWHYVLNLNTILLLLVNAALIIVSWLNFAARGNKLAGSIDNAFGTALALVPPEPEYYDNNNIKASDLRFALNVYESCFFSEAILSKQTLRIIVKNLLIAVIFLTAIILENSHVVMSLLGLFLVVHYLRKLFVFSVVKSSLTDICNMFQMILTSYKKGMPLDMPAIVLNLSNYETAMVWLGTVLSGKIYNQINAQLTKDWQAKQQSFLRTGDTQ